MKLIALIEQEDVIKKILDHLGLPSEPPTAIGLSCRSSRRERSRTRPPPEDDQLELFDVWY